MKDETTKKNDEKKAENKPEKEEENEFQKALDKWEQNGLPPPGEYTLSILVERCLHLPIADVAVQSPSLVGSCDAYVKVIVGQNSKRTSVKSGTLYPEFDEEFSFFVNKDKKARKKSQSIILQVWDWDFGKKDDFLGQASVCVASLIKSYEERTERHGPFVDWLRLPILTNYGHPVREMTDRTGHKAGKAPGSELHFRVQIEKTYDLRQVSETITIVSYYF